MNWSERPADVAVRTLTELLGTLPALEALMLVCRLHELPAVHLSHNCRDGILTHLRSHDTEVGGLLFGHFNQPYSVGLVIDPVQHEEACFIGPDSLRCRCPRPGMPHTNDRKLEAEGDTGTPIAAVPAGIIGTVPT